MLSDSSDVVKLIVESTIKPDLAEQDCEGEILMMLRHQIVLIIFFVICVPFVSCDEAQQMVTPITQVQEPIAPESTDTSPLMIVSITHYRDGSDIPIAEGERVPVGTTLLTEIVFSESVKVDNTLKITYTTNKGEKRYGTSQSGVDWRGTCQLGKHQNSVRCKADASIDPFIVRVHTASALNGNTISEPVTASEIDVDTIHLSNNRIDENQPIGSIVGTFSVPVGKRFAYSVVDGDKDFGVADGTKLVTNKVFNHEVQWTYQITVRETDRETNESLEKTYDIFINDLNEAPTDLSLTGNTFYREDGVGTMIGQLLITDEDRQDEHHVRVTQGGDYVEYDNGYLHVLQLFDQATKEIAVEVTDQAGLVYTETFEISMKERHTESSEPTETMEPDKDEDDNQEQTPPQPEEGEDNNQNQNQDDGNDDSI